MDDPREPTALGDCLRLILWCGLVPAAALWALALLAFALIAALY